MPPRGGAALGMCDMADYWDDSPDYLEQHRERRLRALAAEREQQQQALAAARARRREALKSVARICYQVTTDGRTLSEFTFDRPPTLGELVARAGGEARVLAVGRPRQA